MTKDQTEKLVATLLALDLSSSRRSAADVEVLVCAYHRMLRDLPYEFALAAAMDCAADSRFFPKVSEIRKTAIRRHLGAPTYASAIAAIADAAKERETSAQRKQLAALHPFVRRALNIMGGLYDYRGTTNPTAWRSQFREIYTGVVDEQVAELNHSGLRLPMGETLALLPGGQP